MDSIVKQHGSAQQKILDSILNPVRQMLTDGWILQYCRSIGHVWRCRRFCPVVSLLACIWKQLGQFSARDVEDYVALLARTCDDTSRDGRDFCNARARLPLPLFSARKNSLAPWRAIALLAVINIYGWLCWMGRPCELRPPLLIAKHLVRRPINTEAVTARSCVWPYCCARDAEPCWIWLLVHTRSQRRACLHC